jgi:uncharacterized protein YndB with AHSA1/START domain
LSSYRHQAYLNAPVATAWSLIGAPERYPEWWPRIVEVQGEAFEQGDEYVQVSRRPGWHVESRYVIERREDLHEIRMRCQLSSSYAHWTLTPAQGGTFIDLEMGMEPRRLGYRVFDVTVGRPWFKRWTLQSLEGLDEAVRRERSAGLERA